MTRLAMRSTHPHMHRAQGCVEPARRRTDASLVCAAVVALVTCALSPGPASATGDRTGARHDPRLVTSGGNAINDVSCVATGACVAVGQYAVPHGFAALVDVERHAAWNDTVVPLPGFTNRTSPDSELTSVACWTAMACVAVGTVTDALGHQHALLVVEAAGAWHAKVVPLPAGGTTQLDALTSVSCLPNASCAAVGSYSTAKGVEPLILNDVSGTWSAVTTPLPGDADAAAPVAALVAVSCVAGPSCVAVGSYRSATHGQEPLMEADAGGTWSETSAPLPLDASTSSSTNDVLDGVACTSSGSCVAAGSYEDAGTNQEPLLDVESASTWSNVVTALPGDASVAPTLDVLNAVSCSSPGACVAVGVYESEDNYQEALIEVESSGTWSVKSAALPGDANTVIPLDTLTAVSCPEDANCVAVGFYSSDQSYVYPKAFLEVEVNGTWVAGSVAAPADESTKRPYSNLSSISCVSILGCVAGGVYSNLANNAQALLEDLGVAFANVSVVPGPPTDVVAHPGHGQAMVTWRAPKSNGGSRITSYTVTASPGGRHCVTNGATSCTVRPLAATGYSFRVTATSAIGTSPPSESSVPVLVEPPPRAAGASTVR